VTGFQASALLAISSYASSVTQARSQLCECTSQRVYPLEFAFAPEGRVLQYPVLLF
jgi:hypothetical protein